MGTLDEVRDQIGLAYDSGSFPARNRLDEQPAEL
jgi:hypothetical protein